MHRSGLDVDDVQPGDPVIVVARAGSGHRDQLAAVGRPVEVIDVHIGRRDDAQLLRGHVDDGHALLVDVLFDRTDRARHRHERTGGALCILDEEKGDRLPVRRPVRLGQVAVYVRHADRRAADVRHEDLSLFLAAVADRRQRGRVRRPGQVMIIAIAGEKADVHARRRRRRHADSLHRPGDVSPVRRDGHGVERPRVLDIIEEGVVALLRVRDGCGEEKDDERDSAHEGRKDNGCGVAGSRSVPVFAHGFSELSQNLSGHSCALQERRRRCRRLAQRRVEGRARSLRAGCGAHAG